MGVNCSSCKWYRIKTSSKSSRSKLGLSEAELELHCSECLARFKADCEKRDRTCIGCEWKDRSLPYEARKLRCNACADAFAARSAHDCSQCVWNDPRRRMPTDASLAHCKACMASAAQFEASVEGSAMNCSNCPWMKMPRESRAMHCIRCSVRFSGNSKVRNSINELSNKGQTIISYDNHNQNMVDDRDTVANVAKGYIESRKSASWPSDIHPVFGVATDVADESRKVMESAKEALKQSIRDAGIEDGSALDNITKAHDAFARVAQETVDESLKTMFEKMKAFLCEFGQLTDMQALLVLSEVRGDKKTVFARNHNLTDSAVNGLFKQLLVRSPVFREFIVLTRGTIEGTRGRKAKSGNPMDNVPKRSKKTVFVGAFQETLGI